MKYARCVLSVLALTLSPLTALQAADSPAEPTTPDAALNLVESLHSCQFAIHPSQAPGAEVFSCELQAGAVVVTLMALYGAHYGLQSAYRTGQIQGIVAAKVARYAAAGAFVLAEAAFVECYVEAVRRT